MEWRKVGSLMEGTIRDSGKDEMLTFRSTRNMQFFQKPGSRDIRITVDPISTAKAEQLGPKAALPKSALAASIVSLNQQAQASPRLQKAEPSPRLQKASPSPKERIPATAVTVPKTGGKPANTTASTAASSAMKHLTTPKETRVTRPVSSSSATSDSSSSSSATKSADQLLAENGSAKNTSIPLPASTTSTRLNKGIPCFRPEGVSPREEASRQKKLFESMAGDSVIDSSRGKGSDREFVKTNSQQRKVSKDNLVLQDSAPLDKDRSIFSPTNKANHNDTSDLENESFSPQSLFRNTNNSGIWSETPSTFAAQFDCGKRVSRRTKHKTFSQTEFVELDLPPPVKRRRTTCTERFHGFRNFIRNCCTAVRNEWKRCGDAETIDVLRHRKRNEMDYYPHKEMDYNLHSGKMEHYQDPQQLALEGRHCALQNWTESSMSIACWANDGTQMMEKKKRMLRSFFLAIFWSCNFEAYMGSIVLLNILTLSVEYDQSVTEIVFEKDSIFRSLDMAFLIVYTLEYCLRVWTLQCSRTLFTIWNFPCHFDLLILCIGYVCEIILPCALVGGISNHVLKTNLSHDYNYLFGWCRIGRIVRVLRLFILWQPLWSLLRFLTGVVAHLLWWTMFGAVLVFLHSMISLHIIGRRGRMFDAVNGVSDANLNGVADLSDPSSTLGKNFERSSTALWSMIRIFFFGSPGYLLNNSRKERALETSPFDLEAHIDSYQEENLWAITWFILLFWVICILMVNVIVSSTVQFVLEKKFVVKADSRYVDDIRSHDGIVPSEATDRFSAIDGSDGFSRNSNRMVFPEYVADHMIPISRRSMTLNKSPTSKNGSRGAFLSSFNQQNKLQTINEESEHEESQNAVSDVLSVIRTLLKRGGNPVEEEHPYAATLYKENGHIVDYSDDDIYVRKEKLPETYAQEQVRTHKVPPRMISRTLFEKNWRSSQPLVTLLNDMGLLSDFSEEPSDTKLVRIKKLRQTGNEEKGDRECNFSGTGSSENDIRMLRTKNLIPGVFELFHLPKVSFTEQDTRYAAFGQSNRNSADRSPISAIRSMFTNAVGTIQQQLPDVLPPSPRFENSQGLGEKEGSDYCVSIVHFAEVYLILRKLRQDEMFKGVIEVLKMNMSADPFEINQETEDQKERTIHDFLQRSIKGRLHGGWRAGLESQLQLLVWQCQHALRVNVPGASSTNV